MKKRRAIYRLFWMVVFVLTLAGYKHDVNARTYRSADVSVPADGNIFIEVDGTYSEVDTQAIVNRVNEIRWEAYEEGLISQYVPVQWDYGLEYIAQYRAAEANVYYTHERPNGKSNETMTYQGYSTPTENITVATKTDPLEAIDNWYAEKKSIVSDAKEEAPHYEALIRPNLKYIGIGGFANEGNRVATFTAQLKASPSGFSDAGISGEYTQQLEMSCTCAKYVGIFGAAILETGDTSNFTLHVVSSNYMTMNQSQNGSRGRVASSVSWQSSNEAVASVDSLGKVTGKTKGTATITANVGTLSASCVVVVGDNEISGTVARQVIAVGNRPTYSVSGTINWVDGTTSTENIRWEPDENDYDNTLGKICTIRGVANGKIVSREIEVEEATMEEYSFPGLPQDGASIHRLDAEYHKAPVLPETVEVTYTSYGKQFTRTEPVQWESIPTENYMVDEHGPVNYVISGEIQDGANTLHKCYLRVAHKRDQYTITNPTLRLRTGIKPVVGEEDYNIPKTTQVTWSNGDQETFSIEWDLSEIENHPEKNYQNDTIDSYTIEGIVQDTRLFNYYPMTITCTVYRSTEQAEVVGSKIASFTVKNGVYFDESQIPTSTYLEWSDGIWTLETVEWKTDFGDLEDILYNYEGGTTTADYICKESGYAGTSSIKVEHASLQYYCVADAAYNEVSEITTAYGEKPTLPPYEKLIWSNNDVTYHDITWQEIEEILYTQSAGNTFKVTGTYMQPRYNFTNEYEFEEEFNTSIQVKQLPCEGEVSEDDYVLVKKLELNCSVSQLYVGDKIAMSTTCTPENATDQSVTWESSDETVATVDQKGLVHPLKHGTVTISAVSNAKGCQDVVAKQIFTVYDTTGTIGVSESINWFLNRETGGLMIFGNGEIPNYAGFEKLLACPWRGNTDVKYVIVGQGITRIGEYAFYNMNNLVQVYINEGLTSIGRYAFKDSSVNQFHFPKSLEEVDEYAFKGTSAQTLTFYSNLNKICHNAFDEMPLIELNMYGNAPELDGENYLILDDDLVLHVVPNAEGYRQEQWIYIRKIQYDLDSSEDVECEHKEIQYQEYHVDETPIEEEKPGENTSEEKTTEVSTEEEKPGENTSEEKTTEVSTEEEEPGENTSEEKTTEVSSEEKKPGESTLEEKTTEVSSEEEKSGEKTSETPTEEKPGGEASNQQNGVQVVDKYNVGDVIKSGNDKYRIKTLSPNGTGTVSYIGNVKGKSIKKVNVPTQIRLDGIVYKVTEIEKNAFKDCKKLKTVTIGKNIEKIGGDVFAGCKSLKTIVIQSKKLTKKSVSKTAFRGVSTKTTITVPSAMAKKYRKLFYLCGMSSK